MVAILRTGDSGSDSPHRPQVPSAKSSSEQIRPERLPRRLFHSQRRNTVLLEKEEIAAWWGWTTDIVLDSDRFERKAQLLSETTGPPRMHLDLSISHLHHDYEDC